MNVTLSHFDFECRRIHVYRLRWGHRGVGICIRGRQFEVAW